MEMQGGGKQQLHALWSMRSHGMLRLDAHECIAHGHCGRPVCNSVGSSHAAGQDVCCWTLQSCCPLHPQPSGASMALLLSFSSDLTGFSPAFCCTQRFPMPLPCFYSSFLV